MKKLLIAGVSAACIFSVNPASAGKLIPVVAKHLDVPPGGSKDLPLIDNPNGDILCALTGIGGHFAGGGEHGNVDLVDGRWHLVGEAGQPGVYFEATCWRSE